MVGGGLDKTAALHQTTRVRACVRATMKFYGLINYYSNDVTTKDEEVREGRASHPNILLADV